MSDKTTASLEQVIQTAIDSALKELHTCLPAVVSKVNNAEQLIDAQVTIKRTLAGQLVNLPLLVNVPLRYWKSSTFSMTFPIEVGDHVLIIFAERSIDTWLISGGLQNPFDLRKHSLSDAFALPMMYPQTDVIPSFNSTNLEIKTNSGDTKVIVKASEDVEVITTGEVKATCATLVAAATTSAVVTTPTLTVNGDLTVTGTILAPTISATASLLIKAKEMDAHTHPQGVDSDGDTQQNTGAPV